MRRLLLAVLMLVALAGCGPDKAASCWPMECPAPPTTSAATVVPAPAPVVDAAVPAQPASPDRQVLRIRAYTAAGEEIHTWAEVKITAIDDRGGDGGVGPEGSPLLPGPLLAVHDLPVDITSEMAPGIATAIYDIVVRGLPLGARLTCEMTAARPEDVDVDEVIQTDPHGAAVEVRCIHTWPA